MKILLSLHSVCLWCGIKVDSLHLLLIAISFPNQYAAADHSKNMITVQCALFRAFKLHGNNITQHPKSYINVSIELLSNTDA